MGNQKSGSTFGWFLFVVGFAGALFVGWVVFPQVLYSSKTQPFAFSHVTHSENGPVGLSCEECHGFRDDGSYKGIPTLETCFDCHAELQGKSEAEKQFFMEGRVLLEQGKEVDWLIYSEQPPCVYFSHAPHVELAQLECAACHRDVAHEQSPPVYKENRITGYSKYVYDKMKMDDCADCHTKSGTSNACFVCHK
jgi:hypothetical protein